MHQFCKEKGELGCNYRTRYSVWHPCLWNLRAKSTFAAKVRSCLMKMLEHEFWFWLTVCLFGMGRRVWRWGIGFPHSLQKRAKKSLNSRGCDYQLSGIINSAPVKNIGKQLWESSPMFQTPNHLSNPIHHLSFHSRTHRMLHDGEEFTL